MTDIMIRQAMDRVTADPNKINMGRKTYSTVASRVEAMRYVYGEILRIETEILVHPEWRPGNGGNDSVIVVRASILDATGAIISTGHAEEVRGSNRMTETSALEVCETSAIGRALASLGLHGGEYASANEIDIAEGKRARLAGTADKVQAGKKTVAGKGPDVVENDIFAPQAGSGADSGRGPVPAPAGEPRPESLEVENVTALEAFRVFAESCKDSAELRTFWSRNKKILDDLKDDAPHQYAEVKDIFAKREKELRKE
jgi:hypothetical protein